MVEAIGALAIDLALDASAEFLSDAAIDAGVDFATATTLGVSNATLIGSAILVGTTIGLQYALRPGAPKPEDGAQPIKAPLQPRQRGYWDNRLSGAVMLAMTGGAPPTTAVMVAAFHQGPVDSIQAIYFDDDQVGATSSVTHGGYTGSIIGPGGYYADASLSIDMGLPGQVADTVLTGSVASGTWTSAFVGTGIAYWGLIASAPGDPTQFAKLYPRGLPKPSVVARCSPVWDPRDGTQTLADPTTWKVSANPVLQLIDYLTLVDGGMGLDRDTILPASRLALWMDEADLCDADLGGGNIRFRSAGWYTFDTKPEDIIGKLTATFDGWMAPAGNGELALTVGVYRAPTDPPLQEHHIYDILLNHGTPDEQLVNQLDVSFTDPTKAYATNQIAPVRDEDSISLVGAVKNQPLDLSWVQWPNQAALLGTTAMLRINPKKSGTLIAKLYAMRYRGKRWIKLQFPLPGIEDCVIEVQSLEADLLGGTVTITFILYNA